MAKSSSLKRFLFNIYGYSFFNTLIMLSPVYAVFMQEHGMTDMQISSLLMLWSIGVLVAQIPVTWATGKIGAKRILILGQLLKAAAYVLWFVCPTYIGFAAGMLIWGIQGAIYNVVSEDILYDELKARTHAHVYTRVLGVRKNVYTAGVALSSAGSLMLFWGYKWIVVASVAALMISTVFLMRMRLVKKYKRPVSSSRFFKSLADGVRIVGKTPAILMMLVLSVAVTNFSYLSDYLALIGYDIGIPKEYIGIVPFAMLICQMIGQGTAHKFASWRAGAVYPFLGLAGLMFVAFAFLYNVWGLVLVGLAYIICAIIKILLYSRFQDLTPSKYRMEILSLYNIADQSTYMLVCFIIGVASLLGSWRYSIISLGVILAMFGLYALVFVRTRRMAGKDMAVLPVARPMGGDV